MTSLQLLVSAQGVHVQSFKEPHTEPGAAVQIAACGEDSAHAVPLTMHDLAQDACAILSARPVHGAARGGGTATPGNLG